jgi:hypothetical protein
LKSRDGRVFGFFRKTKASHGDRLRRYSNPHRR